MLAAATPSAVAGLFAIELGHDASGVSALGKEVPVAPVIADDIVAFLQCPADADGRGFLSHTEMRSAADNARSEQPVEGFFKLPDQYHILVKLEGRCCVDGGGHCDRYFWRRFVVCDWPHTTAAATFGRVRRLKICATILPGLEGIAAPFT